MRLSLQRLLAPESIAIVGASPRGGRGAGVQRNLQRFGFAGRLYGVNPKYSEVQGAPCYPTLADVPETVDCVVIALPAGPAVEVAQQCADLGVGGAIVFASGFGEMGGELHFVSAMTLDGLLSGEWKEPDWAAAPRTQAELLAAWDALSARIEAEFGQIDPAMFGRVAPLPWGEMPGWVAAIYAVDNEVHHRGQGYVYLRALGTEPPAFYGR